MEVIPVQEALGPTGSLERGLAILKSFTALRRELALTDIAAEVGLSLSTAHRLVNTLMQLGFLVRDPATKRYRPGLQVLHLGFAALEGFALRQVALPILRRLSDSLQATVNCGVLDGPEVIYVIRLARDQIVTTMLTEGSRLSVHCGSMGKCLLAYLPDAERRDTIARVNFVAYTPFTITSPELLEAECQKIRAQGYAIVDQELAIGHRGVAAPVFGSSGQVIAAVNVALPASAVTSEELAGDWAPQLIAAATEVSRSVGVQAPRHQGGPGPSQ